MKLPILCLLVCLLSHLTIQADVPVWVIGGEGIHFSDFDSKKGTLSAPALAAEFDGGSWVMEHPSAPVLYASWGRTGVAAYRIGKGHTLELINRVELPAGAAAHIAVDGTGTVLATAHWGGKSVTLVPLGKNGALNGAGLVTYEPTFDQIGPRPVQTQPRPHWVRFSADGSFLDVTDLGGDRLWRFNVSRSPLGLTVHQELPFPAGFGPRHMDLNANKTHAYVSGELSSEIAVLDYDGARHNYTRTQILRTLGPTDKEPANNTSEVRIHPNGRFVFIGNRGNDSISVFAVDANTGQLTPVEREPIRGIWPRNFNLDPSGKWMIVAGQHSDSLTVFAIDETSGELTFNREIQSVKGPVRVLFGTH